MTIRCWACRASFSADHIHRDGILRGRSARSGGPYRIYGCPSCRKENRIENLADGSSYCSPAKEIGILDWLFGWIEPLAPEDFLEIQRWLHRHAREREAVFDALGDRRYTRSWWRRMLTAFIPRRERSRKSVDTGQGPSRDPEDSPTSTPLPHPYRILGLPAEATSEQIRKRFRELVKKTHPDKLHDANPGQIETASRRLQQLIRSYEELKKRGQV